MNKIQFELDAESTEEGKYNTKKNSLYAKDFLSLFAINSDH